MHLLQNFEAAVRENVTINGQPWAETSADSEPNSMYGFSFILPVFIYFFFFLNMVFLIEQFFL